MKNRATHFSPTDREAHDSLLREMTVFEAFCLEAKKQIASSSAMDTSGWPVNFHKDVSANSFFSSILHRTAVLFSKEKEYQSSKPGEPFDWAPLKRQFCFRPGTPILILAGSTGPRSDNRMLIHEKILQDALTAYTGYLLTGGTTDGICGMAGRCAALTNVSGVTKIDLVGYLPKNIEASPAFANIVRTDGSTFSVLEPIQMWTDLLTSGVHPASVSLLCLGGGAISSQELVLAWALGAHVAALADDTIAPQRFSALLTSADTDAREGQILSCDAATLRSFIGNAQSAQTNDSRRADLIRNDLNEEVLS